MQVIDARGRDRLDRPRRVLRSSAADDRYAVAHRNTYLRYDLGRCIFMTHLLFFYREIRCLENLTDFDRVTGFGRATLRPFNDFLL